MSIDDPISAAEGILANEERERSPVQRYFGQIAACLPSSIAKALSKLLREEEADKLAFMVGVLDAELRRVRTQVEELMNASEAHRAFAHEDWPALLTDGLRRAEQTRAKDRIARIAIILSNALVEEAVPTADDVEEMMRVAMDLADRDVLALQLIAGSASGSLWNDRLSLHHAWDLWRRIGWSGNGFSNSEVESVCSKLASFGLLGRLDLPPNQNMQTIMHNGYELLQKGLTFIRFVHSHVEAV